MSNFPRVPFHLFERLRGWQTRLLVALLACGFLLLEGRGTLTHVAATLAPHTTPFLASFGFIPARALTFNETTCTEVQISIDAAAKRHNIDPSLLRAVIWVESRYNHEAISPAGALGLMQLMPATAALVGVKHPFDAEQNIEGGARYLRKLLTRFSGSEKLALAGYNAGPGSISPAGELPPYPETRNYVRKVLHIREQIRLQRGTFCTTPTQVRG